eukprot:494328-Prorocentrum_minimum.AAC.1
MGVLRGFRGGLDGSPEGSEGVGGWTFPSLVSWTPLVGSQDWRARRRDRKRRCLEMLLGANAALIGSHAGLGRARGGARTHRDVVEAQAHGVE